MPRLIRQSKPSSAGRTGSGEGGPTQSTIPNSRRVARLDRYPRHNNNPSPTQASPPAKSPLPLAKEGRVRVAQPKARSHTAAVWPGSTRPPTPQQHFQPHPQPNTRRPSQASPANQSPLPLAKEDRVRVAPTQSTTPNQPPCGRARPGHPRRNNNPSPTPTRNRIPATTHPAPQAQSPPNPTATTPPSVSSVPLWCILLIYSSSTPTLG